MFSPYKNPFNLCVAGAMLICSDAANSFIRSPPDIPKKQYTFTGTQYFTAKEVEVYAVTEINV
jgi:hypothetical protein